MCEPTNLIHFHFRSHFHINCHIWWPHMTSNRLNKRFWAMFEPTSTWPNFAFGRLASPTLTTWNGSNCTYLEWLQALPTRKGQIIILWCLKWCYLTSNPSNSYNQKYFIILNGSCMLLCIPIICLYIYNLSHTAR